MTSQPDATPAFSDLDLPESLVSATRELGFSRCTEIQGLTLPVIAEGHDIAAQAQTGTGKTAAFLLGAFSRLLANDGGERAQNQPRMLVIAPTRELALQISKDAESLGRYTGLKTAVAYGGIDYDKQRKELEAGVDVLIGTPGRLIDYFKQKVFNLKRLEICVLDEADRMFDLGFIADIRFLLRRMPPPEERLSMLFSATLSHRVMELAYEHMNNPRQIKTEATGVTARGVHQQLFQPASDEKIPLLLGLLREMQPPRAIVFVNTKRVAERVEAYLVGNGFACGTLSGDVRQKKRQRILADFTSGELPILIATDVAARGLHIDDVSHVFNYDLPQQAEDYVHRIGRTARAGQQGEAVSFACEEYSFSLPEIEEYIGQRIPTSVITDELLVKPEKPARIERDRVPRRDGGKPGRGRGSRTGGKPDGRSDSKRDGKRDGKPAGRSGDDTDGRRRRRSRSAPVENGDSDDGQPGSVAAQAATPAAAPAATPVSDAAGDNQASPDGDAPRKKRRRRSRRRRTGTQGAESAPETVTGGSAAGPGDGPTG